MKIFDPKLTGSIEILNTITGDVTLAGNLNVEGGLGGAVTGSATASYIEYTNIDNKPVLLSGSAQIATDISGSFTSLSSSLEGRVSSQESFSSSLDSTYATDAQVSTAVSSLNAATSSYALENSISGSFTSTSQSLASELLKNTTDTLTGDLTVTGTITAQDLHVQEVTSSIVYSSGSNILGNQSSDNQTLKGSTQIISNRGSELQEYNSFNVADDSDTTKGIRLAYDTGSDAGVIAASDLGVGWKDILINPIGGDVGIGTTNPTAKISIKSSGASGLVLESDSSNSSNSGRIFLSNSTTGNAIMTESGILTFRTGATPRSTSGTKRLSVESSGIVTIGDGSTSGTLQFENDIKTRKVVLYQGADNDNEFYGFGIESSTLVYSVFTATDDHVFFSGYSGGRNELMRISGDGRVGIGSTTPEEKLTIDGTISGAYLRISNAASGDISSGIMIYNGSNLDTQIYTNPTFGNTTFLTREKLAIRAGGSERLTIATNGNVGINSTTPSARFQVVEGEVDEVTTFSVTEAGQVEIARNHSTSPRILTTFASGNGQLNFYKSGTLVTSLGNEAVSYFGGGSVGIGTNTPNAKLSVLGTSRFDSYSQSDPDSSSTTNYPAAHTFTHYSESNGMFIVGGQGGYSGTTLTVGQETGAATNFNHFRAIADTNGTPITHFIIKGNGYVGIGTDFPNTYLHVEGDSIAIGSAYNFSINANNDGNWGFQVQRTDGVDDYNTRMKFYPANGSTRKLGFWNASAGEWMGYFDGSTPSDNNFIINGGDVGIGTTDPKTKLQVNGAIGMKDSSGDPINARLVKAGSTSVVFTIKVGAVGAWRAGHAFLKVSGAQNGLQEHHSAWYHLKLVHYYLSGVANSGTSNPALIKDSGGDTSSYTLSVTATNNADPQEITINISDSNGTTNSMIADIDCSFTQGIKDIY
jgi:hypothetical protein